MPLVNGIPGLSTNNLLIHSPFVQQWDEMNDHPPPGTDFRVTNELEMRITNDGDNRIVNE